MNMKDFIQRIRNRAHPHGEFSDEVVAGFLRLLEDIRAEEASCEEIYTRLDEYVETELHGQDAAKIMPLVREHLDVCSDCCEEYEALLDVLEKTEKQ